MISFLSLVQTVFIIVASILFMSHYWAMIPTWFIVAIFITLFENIVEAFRIVIRLDQ